MNILSTFLGLLLALVTTVSSTSDDINHNCFQLVDYGQCQERKMMWAYSKYDHKCLPFIYSTCGGNGNRFPTQFECERVCAFQA